MTGIGAHRCGRLLPLAVFARILFPATWILTPHCRLSPIAAKRRNAAMPDSGYERARAVARHARACAGHDEGMTPATPSAVTLRQVYAATYDDVLRFVQRRCPASRAHDVAQEVFVVAWRRIGDLPASGEEQRAWLFGVAYKVLANANRGERRRHALAVRIASDAAGGGSELVPDYAPDLVAARVDLVRAWQRLSAVHQEALALTVWDELTSAQAAEVLGIWGG